MRLVCPNCDAEYEIDASVIPDNGRDVQCSNCGHAWFQLPPEVEADLEAEEALYDAPPLGVALPDTAAELPHRSMDESVLAVLREEAELETQARQAETPQGIETQTEMGLEAAAAGGLSGAVARRIARLKGTDPDAAAAPLAKAQTRRDMLPEIEEINSTLRASSEKRAGQAAVVTETMVSDTKPRTAFRNGFVLILLLAAVLLAAYVMAPKLMQQFPAATSTVQAYVTAVDAMRVGVDGILQRAIGFMRGLAGGPN